MDWLEAFKAAHAGSYRPAGICLACRKGSGCNGHRYKNECKDYISRELTRDEWAAKYASALEKLAQTKEYFEWYKLKGIAHSTRCAMAEYHDFNESELREIEDRITRLSEREKKLLRREL